MSVPRVVGIEYCRETDRYEAACAWCEDVVWQSETVAELLLLAPQLGPGFPFQGMVPQSVEHDCRVEP